MFIVAVDTGGTFTDIAAFDTRTGRTTFSKSLTTHEDLTEGVFSCVQKASVNLAEGSVFKHGTTLVINTLLERTGARCALVSTAGFRDVLEMGRGNRPRPFDLFFLRDAPLIPRELRFEVDERVNGEGVPVRAPRREEIQRLAETLKGLNIEAVAISFINSYADSQHEEQVAAWLNEALPDVFVTSGASLSREWYEFERTATAAANAYVGPRLTGYAAQLKQKLREQRFSGQLYMMGSNGGVLSIERSLVEPYILVESGPVGGAIGAGVYAAALGLENVISFDMGGTTAKCALVQNGQFEVKSVYYVGGYERGFPIRGAVIDIDEVGAGGGSIAWLDEQRRLNVGPRSAGSIPGPVAYGLGGTEPTVTDANVVLGRLEPSRFLGGEMRLDVDSARRAIQERVAAPLGYTGAGDLMRVANGILSIAVVHMAGAVKRITVERGRDPREFALFCYGGGGPMHGAELARELHIPWVIMPPEPGNFSAIGMLLADLRRDEGRTFLRPLSEESVQEMNETFQALEAELHEALQEETRSKDIVMVRNAELRYRGQVHSVLTPVGGIADAKSLRERFESVYLARYGHIQPSNAVELVGLRLAGHARIQRPELGNIGRLNGHGGKPPVRTRPVYFAEVDARVPTQVYWRPDLPVGFEGNGPAVIEEYGSTTVVTPRDRWYVGALGEIRIEIGKSR